MISTKTKVYQVIKLMKNNELKYFVKHFLDWDVPEQFFTTASSSTGKHHPPEDNGKGGCIRHTLKAIQVGMDLCRLYNLNDYNRDIIITALLLHDSFKNWKDGKWNKHTNYEHGKVGADMIRYRAKNAYSFIYHPVISCQTYKQILKVAHLVEIHMGRWAQPKKYLNFFRKRLEQIIIESDYIASRKGISFKVGKIMEEK